MTKWRHPFHGQLALVCCASHCYKNSQYVQKSHFFLLCKAYIFIMFLKMVLCVVCHWCSVRCWCMSFTQQIKNLETATRLTHCHIHIHVYRYVHQLMVVFWDRIKFCSTTAVTYVIYATLYPLQICPHISELKIGF